MRMIRKINPHPLIAAALAEMTEDDLIEAALWVVEGRLIADLAQRWGQHQDDIRSDLIESSDNRSKLPSAAGKETVREARAAEERIRSNVLQSLMDEAGAAVECCRKQRKTIADDYGCHTRERVLEGAASGDSVGELTEQLHNARAKLAYLRADYEGAMDELSLLEERRQKFMAQGHGTTLDTIVGFNHQRFEEFVASLAERDGYTIERGHGGSGDEGADIIATDDQGTRLVVQCKLRSSPKATIGTGDVQRFNGTARLEHRATVALMVTNVRYTKQARMFASKHAITLIDADGLRHLAEYGDSLRERITPHREEAR